MPYGTPEAEVVPRNNCVVVDRRMDQSSSALRRSRLVHRGKHLQPPVPIFVPRMRYIDGFVRIRPGDGLRYCSIVKAETQQG